MEYSKNMAGWFPIDETHLAFYVYFTHIFSSSPFGRLTGMRKKEETEWWMVKGFSKKFAGALAE